jgi:hypothetical protein
LKIPYYGIDRLGIFAKLLETHARGVTENLFYRINYVRDTKLPSSMRHEQPRSDGIQGSEPLALNLVNGLGPSMLTPAGS